MAMGRVPYHSACPGLELEQLEELAAIEAIAPEWEALSRTQRPWFAFQTPQWNLCWWRHLSAARPLVTDQLRVCAVRYNGELVAVAPLMLTERPAVGPWRVRMIQAFGADPGVTESRGIICDPRHEVEVYRALWEHLNRRADEWDFVKLNGLKTDGLAHATLARHPEIELLPAQPNFELELPSSWERFKSTAPRNLKESLRKCYNSLKREGHRPELRVIAGGSGVSEALERFFSLHASRAARADTTLHANVFAAPACRAFLHDYFKQAAPGSALVFQLTIGGAVVASRLGFRSEESLYLYYSGYEPEWGRFSVMTTLLAESLKWAIAEGVTSANLSFGRDVSKTRWRPRQHDFHEARWSSRSLRGDLLRRAFDGLTALRRHEHFGPATRGLLGRVSSS